MEVESVSSLSPRNRGEGHGRKDPGYLGNNRSLLLNTLTGRVGSSSGKSEIASQPPGSHETEKARERKREVDKDIAWSEL